MINRNIHTKKIEKAFLKPYFDCGDSIPKDLFRYLNKIIQVKGQWFLVYSK